MNIIDESNSSSSPSLESQTSQDYADLTPDFVLDAIESQGYLSDLRILTLNSYENRVFQIGIEDSTPVIAKFYRPNRWTDAQIIEEHDFSLALHALEIPVIPPIVGENKATLHHYNGHRFAIYERKGGHAPELSNLDTLFTLGQHMGRIHAVGSVTPFTERPELSLQTFGYDARDFLLANNFIPSNLLESYQSLTNQLFEAIEKVFQQTPYNAIRLHGDCHPGNIIVRPDSMYLVDLDDARSGPAIQDLWMLISGDEQTKRTQLSRIVEGYEEFFKLDYREFALIEPLRTLRIIHYASWIAKRWTDPAFPRAFPWFNTEHYWSQHILELREQLSEIDEPVISIQ